MSATYQERWNAALMNNYGTPALELVRGSGAEVWDSDGVPVIGTDAGDGDLTLFMIGSRIKF